MLLQYHCRRIALIAYTVIINIDYEFQHNTYASFWHNYIPHFTDFTNYSPRTQLYFPVRCVSIWTHWTNVQMERFGRLLSMRTWRPSSPHCPSVWITLSLQGVPISGNHPVLMSWFHFQLIFVFNLFWHNDASVILVNIGARYGLLLISPRY